MAGHNRPQEPFAPFYPVSPLKSKSNGDVINSMSGAARFRRFVHSHHKHHLHHPHRQNLSPSPTTPSPTIPEVDSVASESSLETRGIFHFHHTTPVKVDSDAGATGTSVAQLPGRHFIVPPWLAMVVWLSLLFFIGLTVAGFTLSYQARKEFRMRVEEQRKAQQEVEHETTECKIPITTKEFKSFTRKSIMVLNSSSPRGRHQQNNSVYSIDKAGELRPRNMFDRPPRESILVAEITSSGNFSGDDPFYEFSRQMTREGLWDLAARKSKVISVVSLSSVIPKIGKRNSNRFTMMDLAQEELDDQNYQSNLQDNLARPSNSRALRSLEASQGANLRIENHVVQPNRFVPPVPKLPVRFAHDQADSGEKLSSFNDITFLPFNEDKQFSFMDPTTPPRTRIHPPQRTTSRRGRAVEESTHLERSNSQSRPIDLLSPPQRSTSLRGKPERIDSQQSRSKDGHSYELDEPTQTLARATTPFSDVSPDDAVAQYASARAAAMSPLPDLKAIGRVERVDTKQSGSRDGHNDEYQHTTETLVRATTPFGDFSPDDAVAQYASARAAAMSPAPNSKASRSGSVLGFIRRSTTPTPHSLDGRESPAPLSQTRCMESITEPLPMRSQHSQDAPLASGSLSDNEDEYCKPFSVIYEEDDDEEDYFSPTRPHHNAAFAPSSSSFWDASSGRSPETENIPLPRRLPPASLSRTPSHTNRLRSHTVTSLGPASVAMTPTSSSSSFGARSTSGSSGARGPENSLNSSLNYLSSPNEPSLTLKRNPSLSTNPYGRRRKQQDDTSLNQQQPPSPRRPVDRHLSDRQDRPIKRHPSHSSKPRGSTSDNGTSDPTAPTRRAVSAQARIPLSGTMSSGGVRNSSFVP
ncbi:hypothetical protein, variant [Puccinia triticina 1-1 BBBD Race 1]|uniref:Uncharacterized protein n=1 Tax=Puccinia triticina (isolate 1-1 / race 1 (BBBD)) TaxID=630390 RepID=A0A180H2L8_PUCT1|nr:hypothetical protein PTTG_01782 [Puccinia triticina 1-1 BBBD Race 1]OAV98593.1 hypothetical protein, variant [Puccinia triticina 1-1 BBBD Race 1]